MFKSLQLKILVSFCILNLVACGTLGIMVYNSAVNLVTSTIGTQAKAVIEMARNQVDTEALKKVINEVKRLENDPQRVEKIVSMPEYQSIRTKLTTYRITNGIKYLYTMAKQDDGSYMYVIDGFPLDYSGSQISLPGDVEKEYYEDMDSAFTTQRTQIGQLTFSDKWGANISTYVPIFDSKGTFVGIMGADFDASEVYQILDTNKKNIIALTISILFISAYFSYIFSHYFLHPLRQLTDKVAKVRGGDLSIQVEVTSQDEIGQLALSFRDMISELQVMFEQVSHLAYHDTLTGLPNRRSFETELSAALSKKDQAVAGAVLFIDLDQFKAVNDTWGHDVGDALLQEVARRLVKIIFGYGMVARLGGDEFIVLLHKYESLSTIKSIAIQILESLQPPITIDSYQLPVTPSIGIALFPEHGKHPQELIQKADIAMYSVKQHGKNSFAFYSPTLEMPK
ncbi:diguanylate cyclase domain-containing protein [Brevibacillus dissolubilis]|uniref:diguanylate cyclase domain-containing protein n=1 Tax=Brevibacillus dissolubilis TaxID=1844116 RepID=UPI00159B880A|nr:diguanylate cyclase [Brevibacillus dissolubilis]